MLINCDPKSIHPGVAAYKRIRDTMASLGANLCLLHLGGQNAGKGVSSAGFEPETRQAC